MSAFLIRLQRLIYRNRSIAFTPSGNRFVLLTLVVGVAAINTGNNLLYLIVGMMLSLIIVSGILSEQSLRDLIVEWEFPPRVFAQQAVITRLHITNGKKFLPSFSFRVEGGDFAAPPLYVFKLSARQTITHSCTTSFPERGHRTPPSLVLRTTFPFGFFHKSLIRPQAQKVLVYPRILPLPVRFETERPHAGQSYERRQRGSGVALHSLRDYTSADDARGIHWKASARGSKLLLKEYDQEEDPRILLCLSHHIFGGQVEDFERAIKLAASLAVALTRQGYPVRLQTFSQAVEKVRLRRSRPLRNPHVPAPYAPVPSGPAALHPELFEQPARQTSFSTPCSSDAVPSEGSQDLDSVLKTLSLLKAFGESMEVLSRRIVELANAAGNGGYRVLILPFPDPAWDGVRNRYSEVWVASEPRFREWEAQGGFRR